ncbi:MULTISPECIES: hypothetical protein [Yersinia]|uniref:hypothetical protein n=1 Tax=Yersinia TaxID=629 RepID=UPI0011A18F19|nr:MULTISPECIES: hypothetical protein [Yersinia]MDN0096189.1 hypothetical protein [Yersinia rohdei]
MEKKIAWPDLFCEIKEKGIKGAAICNGQHIINSESMVVGYLSTPIGEEPYWFFFSKPTYEANQSMKDSAILLSNTSFEGYLFQQSTTLIPPFKTSTQLKKILDSLSEFENE